MLKDDKGVGHTWTSLELGDGRTVHSRLVVCALINMSVF